MELNLQKQIIKIGIIGLGRMGRNHLRLLSMLKDVELSFVFDTNVEVAKHVGSTYGVFVADDLKSSLCEVDAVIIASPTVTHAEYMNLAAKYVKNIFVEKPIADTLAAAVILCNITQENSLNVQVGFIERFNPAVQQLKNVIDQSKKVVSIDFTRTNKISSRITDVDVVTDLMIHDIDLALYLSGPVEYVSTHGFYVGPMIDYASALLTHTNGRFSRILASRITDKKVRSIQVTCLDMYVDCNLLRKEIVIHRQAETRQSNDGPYVISALEETVEVRPQEALLSELQAFLSSCQGKSVDRPDAVAGVEAMRICDQIQNSVLK
jgi:predicted dehydrogenase